MTDDELHQELYEVAHRLGMKPQAARDAIESTEDVKGLLRKWRGAHAIAGRRILAEKEKREAEDRAEESRERHATLKDRALHRREFARGQMRLGQRLDVAIAEAECLSGVASSMGSFGMKISGSTNGVPVLELPLEDLEKHLFVVKARLKMIEEDLDAAKGLAPPPRTQWTTAQKDAMVVSADMRGMSPEAISEAYPFLGVPLTIRRVRRLYGLRSGDGTPNPKSIYAKAA